MSNLSKWFWVPKPNPSAYCRLICMPCAGGSIGHYLKWAPYLDDKIELVAVELPGRVSRLLEPAYTDMTEVIDDLFALMEPFLDKPYILFGHSMGATIFFELMHKIRENGLPSPLEFIAASSAAPNFHQVSDSYMYSLPEQEFIKYLLKISNIHQELLDDDEFMGLVLPSIRADFQMIETYRCNRTKRVSCDASVFYGESDDGMSEDSLNGWVDFFDAPKFEGFSGGHFFIDDSNSDVVLKINEIVSEYV